MSAARPASTCRRRIYIFRLWARAKGYVPLFAHWEEEDNPEETLPAEFTFRLQRGTVIGGIVRDQAGQPIQGATVEVSLDTRGQVANLVSDPTYWLAEATAAPTTDAQGRWTLDNVPAGDDVEVILKVGHPDYISDPEWGTLQKEQGVDDAGPPRPDGDDHDERRPRRRRGRSPIRRASRSPERSSSGVRIPTWSGAARRCGPMLTASTDCRRCRAGR